MAVAGKVAITLSTENGGAWSADVTYDRLVAVKHNNNLYISRKKVANVEPPNDEFWFLALEGFSGDDIEKIISGETPVGNANLLEGLTTEEVGASGARNLIPYPYLDKTKTTDGIVWTDNGDGTVIATGANTVNSQNLFSCRTRTEATGLVLSAGTYTISGCPKGGSLSTYYIQVGKTLDGSYHGLGHDFGEGVTVTLNEDTRIQIQLVVRTQETVNLTFRPMLELGSVAHDYVPYHFGGAEDAKTVNGFAVYTDVSQLGLSATATLLEVYNAMPYLSELECNSSVLTDDSWNFPSTAGTVKIVKINAIRGYLEFRQKTGTAFYWMGLDNSSPSLPDGAWHNIADGGNAKTLDGHGAEYFAPLSRINGDYLTTSILEKALTAPLGISEYKLGGDRYNGGDLPHYAWTYSTAIVYKRATNSIVVMLVCELYDRTLINRYGGTTWAGWVESANTADLAKYLPLTGGTVNGSVKVVANQTNPLTVENPSGQNSTVNFKGSTGTLGSLGFNTANNPAYAPNDGSAWYSLFHTGNKPTGTYTGNGSATERTINTGGVGSVLSIYSPYDSGVVIATPYGAICKVSGSVSPLGLSEITFSNGVLTIKSTHLAVNANGQTYYYQVL